MRRLLGHHVLGHTAREARDYPESRARETASDKFAFKTMAAAGMNPITAVVTRLLTASFECSDTVH